MPTADDQAISIRAANSAEDIALARGLFEAYAASLSVDLCFQDFATELAALPGAYAAPAGVLLLALDGAKAVGCVALRPLPSGHDAEMKRLYLAPAARGRGVGRRLVETLLAHARALGYRRIFLDTLPEMAVAQQLYRQLNFVETGAYAHNPVPGAKFFCLTLD